MTPGIILALGVAISLVLATVLHHRRETAALYLASPRTPERDAGFDEGLEHAAKTILKLAEDGDPMLSVMALVGAIRAARRGGSR